MTQAGHELWRRHPHVRTGGDLTLGERAADKMRNGFGSWAFVGTFALTLAAWMVINTAILGDRGFDRYPYILLNLMLSCLAALQGAFILIAAKRADRIAAEQALAHYQETAGIDALITANNHMTATIQGYTSQLADIHQHLLHLAGQGPDQCLPPEPPGPAGAGA